MRVGTKSVLFGAHQFLIHPCFVALAWWKLYGFPRQPWLWVAFFVHDLGYWGKPEMDGEEGEQHPRWGAGVLYWLQGVWILLHQRVFYRRQFTSVTIRDIRWWNLRRRWCTARLSVARQDLIWGNEVMFHSRFLAKLYGTRPSRLCIADKLALVLTPSWLYLPMARATGELDEYMYASQHEITGENRTPREWHRAMKDHMARWVEEHRDGREDTWTPERRRAVTK